MIITLLKDTQKSSGIVKHLRFRLRDTGIDIKYRSDIQASVEDLQVFDSTGRPSKNARFGQYNKELAEDIEAFMSSLMDAYNTIIRTGRSLTYDNLRDIMERGDEDDWKEDAAWFDVFKWWADFRFQQNIVSPRRHQQYMLLHKLLYRFSVINHYTGLRLKDIEPRHVSRLQNYIQNEYLYVSKHKSLYDVHDRPTTRMRSNNTVAILMSILIVFFKDMVTKDIVMRSPFERMAKEERCAMTRQQFDAPVFLRADEYRKIRDMELPDTLAETRDMFILNCLLGCRISDFMKICRDRISISSEGIAFFRYVPTKTSNRSHDDVETPLVKTAVDILKKYDFTLPLKNHNTAKLLYNERIRTLIAYANLDHSCKIWNEDTRQNELVAIDKVASSKTARKTHEDMMVKVQLNLYTTGLHAVGSGAIEAYTKLELIDKYKMMCLAFSEPVVFFDKDFNEKSTDASRTSASLNENLE